MFRLLNNAALVQHLRSDLGIGVKMLFQRFEANFEPLLLKNIGKAALRQTAVKRHLAALKTDFRRIARPGFLSFFTAAGSLAQASAGTTPEALLFVRRSFGWMQII